MTEQERVQMLTVAIEMRQQQVQELTQQLHYTTLKLCEARTVLAHLQQDLKEKHANQ
jgi:hypothetical protein